MLIPTRYPSTSLDVHANQRVGRKPNRVLYTPSSIELVIRQKPQKEISIKWKSIHFGRTNEWNDRNGTSLVSENHWRPSKVLENFILPQRRKAHRVTTATH